MTAELTKQDVVKMRKEVNNTICFGDRAPKGREYWDIKRIVKTLERFSDRLICEGCFDPSCGHKIKERSLIFKTLDSLCEDMSESYVITEVLKWIVETRSAI